MGLDPAAELVLRWAHTAAKGAERGVLEERDILAALALLCNRKDPSLGSFLLGLRWPVDSYRTARRLEKLAPEERPGPIHPQLLSRFTRVHDHADGPLSAEDLLEMILYQDERPLVSELVELNGSDKLEAWLIARLSLTEAKTSCTEGGKDGSDDAPAGKTEAAPSSSEVGRQMNLPLQLSLWDSLRDADVRRSRLARRLLKKVLGQDMAVGMLADAYFRQSLRWDASNVKGIFTFIGPPGVGKTLLAESFAQALAEIESAPVAFKRFDMSAYAGRQNYQQLFGAEPYWMGSQPGTLTSFVKENPSAVLLFDEIEKAHPTAIQSLLPVLDSGKALDNKLNETVSFRGCWLLFTTNLGRELWAKPGGMGILRGGADAKDLAWDLLANGRRTGEGDDKSKVPALIPEFVSRLAKGEAVFFRPLRTESLQAIAERAVVEELRTLFAALQLKRPVVNLAPSACRIFLLSQGPRIDARRTASQGAEWALSILDQARACAPHPLPAAPPASVSIMCGTEAEAYLEKKLDARRPNLLLMDDDDYLTPGLRNIADSLKGTFHRVSTTQDVELSLGQRLPDVVLLDLSIDADAESTRVDSALSFLALLGERLPHVPVYLFSENPDLRGAAFRAVILGILKQGLAKDFFPCSYDPAKPESLEPFLEKIRWALDQWRFESLLRDHQRANVTVSADFACALEGEETLRVEMAAPRQTRAPSMPDVLTGNFYQGIPQERFDDLIGVARAKERLRSVLDWLKDPTLLGRFGLRPPRGYLLSGPPGTGKTMLARALAGEARLPFLPVSASQLFNRWTGGTEEAIRQLFEQADRYAPSIIFIDEIDALAAGGGEGKGGRGPLSQFLVCMDGVQSPSRPVFVLGATNDDRDIDRALLRPGRFDEVIQVDLPNQEARKAFFERRLKDLPWEGPRDITQLALAAWLCSPAEMDRMVRETAYLLAKEGRTAFAQTDLLKMIHLVQYGASRPDKSPSEEQKRITAWHEAGHAVVAKILLPFRHLDYLTIIPNDRGYLGLMGSVMEEENRMGTAKEILSYMAVSMGGRAGEMKLTGGLEGVTTGCGDDLTKAARRAYEAITALGLDPEFGPVGLSGLPSSAQGSFQTKAAERVRGWIEEAEKAAKQVLDEHADKLEALAEALLKAETMDGDAIEKVLG